MIAYKLFRIKRNGSVTSLFIDNRNELPINEWMMAGAHETKGYKFRPGWHCLEKPEAPHLSMKNRVWCEVEIRDFKIEERPVSQGGKWYLAKQMKIIREI